MQRTNQYPNEYIHSQNEVLKKCMGVHMSHIGFVFIYAIWN